MAPGQPVPGQPVAPAVPVAAAGGASNFGTVTVAPGFMPDPSVARGTSGGAIQASTLNPQCRGWVSQTPDHILMATGQFAMLRVMVNGGSADTTLVIQRPDGSYNCDDDTEGRNPVFQGNFAPGAYKVWIGSYTQGENAAYTLGISELGSVNPSSLPAPAGAAPSGATAATASNFGTISINPGFMPDPNMSRGTSGGAIQASTLNSTCRGWVSSTPDHIFMAAGNFTNLRVLVGSDQDTTLVIQRPDGQYMCNDDTEGTNPIVSGAFPPGAYKIWIGSYNQGQNSAYRLGFTEMSSVSTRDPGFQN